MNNSHSTILIIDDDPMIRLATVRLLSAQGYTVDQAADGLTGIQRALEYRPQLILLDVDLPDINGMEVCRQLKAHRAMDETFIVMISNSVTDSDSQARGIELGADSYIARPIPNRELLARVQALFRIHAAETAVRIKVEQQSVLVELAQLALAGVEVEELFTTAVTRSTHALHVECSCILRLLPDNATLVMAAGAGWSNSMIGQSIMVDAEMAEKMAGLLATPPLVMDRETIEAHFTLPEMLLKKVGDHRFTILQGEQGPYGLLGVHAIDVCEFSTDDARFMQALTSLLSLAIMRKQAEENVQYVAMHDGLTGLYNRSYFNEEFRRLEGGRQYPISIIMIDVDGLKRMNDVHGHAAGDRLLQIVSAILHGVFRAEDVVARIGGDEFAVLLPNTDQASVAAKIQQIHDIIASEQFDLPDRYPVSISIGYATAGQATELPQTMQIADAMMYQEKAEHHRVMDFNR